MSQDPKRVLVVDANVLINLIHVARLEIYAEHLGFTFIIPDHVDAEIVDDAQRTMLDRCVARGLIQVERLEALDALALFAELSKIMETGEAACLALAITRGWLIASDERRRFRREAAARLGAAHVLTTVDLYLRALDARLLSVDEADQDKALLEQHRFTMKFGSFRELWTPPSS